MALRHIPAYSAHWCSEKERKRERERERERTLFIALLFQVSVFSNQTQFLTPTDSHTSPHQKDYGKHLTCNTYCSTWATLLAQARAVLINNNNNELSILIFILQIKKHWLAGSWLAHAWNPSYSGGRDQEDCRSRPVLVNSWQDSISKLPNTKKGWGVSQVTEYLLCKLLWNPEFKSQQYCQKTTNKKQKKEHKLWKFPSVSDRSHECWKAQSFFSSLWLLGLLGVLFCVFSYKAVGADVSSNWNPRIWHCSGEGRSFSVELMLTLLLAAGCSKLKEAW
jgi:hypothetical protein